ncbi:MAG: hypothetical protein KKE89_09780, partial [Actinobacteria bacterium]|nr:hypothetical protein [Actinomycetota bacterium]
MNDDTRGTPPAKGGSPNDPGAPTGEPTPADPFAGDSRLGDAAFVDAGGGASGVRPLRSWATALLSSLVSGAGQWAAGRRGRALSFFVPVASILAAGLL